MAVRIREATEEDAPFVAWAQLIAARSHLPYGPWDHILGLPEDETLAFLERLACTESEHWCHHSRFLVAEVDGTPAAALCAFDPTRHGGAALDGAVVTTLQSLPRSEPQGDGPDLAAGLARAAAVGTCMPDYADGAWVVENVATRPEFRGRGLVQDLLGAALARGREQGFRVGQIAVLVGNEVARRAYLRAGYAPDLEKRHPAFLDALGCPGIERLLRDPI
jgi:ribosomal protein S18 acetylase RimI-like enzyme